MSLSFATSVLYCNICGNPNGKWKIIIKKLYLLEINIYHMSAKGQLTILWLDDQREPYKYFAAMEKDKKKK